LKGPKRVHFLRETLRRRHGWESRGKTRGSMGRTFGFRESIVRRVGRRRREAEGSWAINRPVHIQSTVHTERVSGDSVFLSVSSLPPRLPTHESERVPLSPAAAPYHTIERMIERLPRVFPSYSVALGSVLAVGRSGENPENPSSTYSIFLVNQNSSINSKNIAYEACVQRWSHGKISFSFLQLTM